MNDEELIPLSDLGALRHRFTLYRKITSLARLQELALPILSGFVLTRASDSALDYLVSWARSRGNTGFTIRLDSSLSSDHARLMSFNPKLDELGPLTQLLSGEVVALVLEENDRTRQGYNVLSAFHVDRIVCEVLGPGFDGSDITRGHTVAHEEIVLHRFGGAMANRHWDISFLAGEFTPSVVMKHSIIDSEGYAHSIASRLAKLKAMKRVGAGIAVNRIIDSDYYGGTDQIMSCFEVPYVPICANWDKIVALYQILYRLDRYYSPLVTGKTLSASFAPFRGLTFWDLYGA